ncbi:MAG TPA: pilus assembly PilX N-terminal domain-containing protein [Candidatus Acidoferrales bacterium]|nr:pilus assembly PilX N-terminal domain-containing protein [Candidatus Acidoferrales bacterium]
MSNHTTQQREVSSEKTIRTRRTSQSGVALIIAIVGLLLITAVAAGMILVETSETNVDANYREQQVALMAAKAGIQEARDRMLSSVLPAGDAINLPCQLPGGTATAKCGQAGFANNFATYITAPGVLPTGGRVRRIRALDTEFTNEMGWGVLPGGNWFTQYNSDTANYSAPAANPIPYQWVRINLKVDRSATENGNIYYVDGIPGNALDQVMYDPNTQTQCVLAATTPLSSACNPANPNNGTIGPVYEITSFAVTRLSATAMVQDEVATGTFNLNVPSALTLPGPLGSFNPPNSSSYCMDGNDTTGATSVTGCSKFTAPPTPPGGCGPASAGRPAIGVSSGDINGSTTETNQQYVTNQIPRPGNYTGTTGTTPSVSTPSLPANMSSPAALEQEIALIQQYANVCLGCTGPSGGTYTFSSMDSAPGSLWGSCGTNCGTTPQITYVNGNMDISGSTTGSGILVVTGNLTYDGNSSWNGIILVVGSGTTTYTQNGGGNGQFNGAIFVANTAGPNGGWGPSDFTINGGGGNGIYYNSCWVNQVQKPITYKLLSTKVIPQ